MANKMHGNFKYAFLLIFTFIANLEAFSYYEEYHLLIHKGDTSIIQNDPLSLSVYRYSRRMKGSDFFRKENIPGYKNREQDRSLSGFVVLWEIRDNTLRINDFATLKRKKGRQFAYRVSLKKMFPTHFDESTQTVKASWYHGELLLADNEILTLNRRIKAPKLIRTETYKFNNGNVVFHSKHENYQIEEVSNGFCRSGNAATRDIMIEQLNKKFRWKNYDNKYSYITQMLSFKIEGDGHFGPVKLLESSQNEFTLELDHALKSVRFDKMYYQGEAIVQEVKCFLSFNPSNQQIGNKYHIGGYSKRQIVELLKAGNFVIDWCQSFEVSNSQVLRSIDVLSHKVCDLNNTRKSTRARSENLAISDSLNYAQAYYYHKQMCFLQDWYLNKSNWRADDLVDLKEDYKRRLTAIENKIVPDIIRSLFKREFSRLINSSSQMQISGIPFMAQDNYAGIMHSLLEKYMDEGTLEILTDKNKKIFKKGFDLFHMVIGQLEAEDVLLFFTHYYPDAVNQSFETFKATKQEKSYACIALKKDGVADWIPLASKGGKAFENEVFRRYENYLMNHSCEDPDHIVYKNYFSKVDTFLQEHKIQRVYWFGEGVYKCIALEALKDVKGLFLMDKYEMVRIRNFLAIETSRENQRMDEVSSVLLVGDPNFQTSAATDISQDLSLTKEQQQIWDYLMKDSVLTVTNQEVDSSTRTGLENLSFSLREIKFLNKVITSNREMKTNCITGDQASEQVVRRALYQPYDIIHFSSHSFRTKGFYKSSYKGSGDLISVDDYLWTIPLAGANGKKSKKAEEIDGHLSAIELSAFSLKEVEFAVLSMCMGINEGIKYHANRHLARYSNRNEESLIAALQLAGIKEVMAPLWAINDESSSVFMTLFYQNLLNHNMGKREALREAQRRLRKVPSFSAPIHWAGYYIY